MKMKYSTDGKVRFDPESHTYWLGTKRLQGVTGLIEKFKTPFDSDAIATKYALKHGLDKEQLLIEWEEKARRSRDEGTAVHKMIEEYILSGTYSILGAPKEKAAEMFIHQYFKTGLLIPVAAELVVHNAFLATQIDCIAKNKNEEYFILDWKTNGKISDNGYGKFMRKPFSNYPDASFFHYSLQLTLCKRLCNEYPISKAYIIHLKEDSFQIMDIEEIYVPDEILKYE